MIKNHNNIQFEILDKKRIKEFLPELYYILHSNMTLIEPTGMPYEESYNGWKDIMPSVIEEGNRQVILIYFEKNLVGYFMYSITEEYVLKMEEIELSQEYQKRFNIFRNLYEYLICTLPNSIELVEAYSLKKNIKSQGILKRMGLSIVGENKNNYHFRGTYLDLCNWINSSSI